MNLIKHNYSYRMLWFAQIASGLGDGIARLIVTLMVAQLTNNPLAFSMVILSQVLPQVLFGSFIGPLIDRFKRTHIMAASGLFRAIVVLGFIFSQDNLILIYILIWLEGMGTLFFEPTRAAFIPSVVGKDNVTAAVSFSQSTFMALQIVGPAIAGFLIPIAHFGWLFTITALTFSISAALIYSLRGREHNHAVPSSSQQVQQESARQQSVSYFASLREGFRTLSSHQGLLALLVLVFPIMLVVGIINTNITPSLLQIYLIPAEKFGFITSCIGIGGIIGATVVPYFLRRLKANVLLLSAVSAIGLCTMAIYPLHGLYELSGSWTVFVWATVLGFSTACTNVPLSSLFITLVPDKVRGRGAAIFGSVVQGGTIAGIGLGGLGANLFGLLESSAIAGLLLLIVVAVFPLLKYNQALRQTGSTTPQEESQHAISSSG